MIVGASRGLGLGLTRELASRGWHVIATAREPARAKPLQDLAAGSGGKVSIEVLDVTRDEDLDALAARLGNRQLDLLFVNAGISGQTRFDGPGAARDPRPDVETATREALSEVLWTNSIAPLRIAHRLLPRVPDGGTIGFMSSVLGSIAENTSGGFDLYRISKVSLNMLARSFAVTQATPRRIATLCLHPGWVRTDMGGPAAPVAIEDSVRGLANVLESRHPPEHRFIDYTGRTLPW